MDALLSAAPLIPAFAGDNMKTLTYTILFMAITSPLFGYDVLSNAGFEYTTFSPWYQDRAFGYYREWMIGTHNPAEGLQNAFCLGRVELRQDFAPVPAKEIGILTFQARQQFTGLGPMWVEMFYHDGTSTGFIEIELAGSHVWQTIDLLPFLDHTQMVNGISVFGIPDNPLVVDDFRIVVDTKRLSIALLNRTPILSWFGRPGYAYQLMHSIDLHNWTMVEEFHVTMPGIITHEWLLDHNRAFFRLNIIEANSEQTPAGDVLKAAPEE